MMKPRDRWDSLIRYHAERHGVDWQLMKAQVRAESGGDPNAVSPVGARGLAQFMPTTWWEWWDERVGIQGPPPTCSAVDPDVSLGAMAAYLAWLRGYLRHLAPPADLNDVVLTAYNWGVGRTRRHLYQYRRLERHLLPTETRGYLVTIARYWAEERGRSTIA